MYIPYHQSTSRGRAHKGLYGYRPRGGSSAGSSTSTEARIITIHSNYVSSGNLELCERGARLHEEEEVQRGRRARRRSWDMHSGFREQEPGLYQDVSSWQTKGDKQLSVILTYKDICIASVLNRPCTGWQFPFPKYES